MFEQLSIFHNTIALEGEELEEAKIQAGTQNHAVLSWFRDHAEDEFTPSFLLSELILHEVLNALTPLTSIRRTLSDLTRKGLLEKTGNQFPGPLGKPECSWRLKE